MNYQAHAQASVELCHATLSDYVLLLVVQLEDVLCSRNVLLYVVVQGYCNWNLADTELSPRS